MRQLVIVSLSLAFFLYGCKETEKMNFDFEPISYPETKKVDTIDQYFGMDVPDPYRWLEDDLSEETAQWVAAQNKVTFGFLEKIPYRDAWKARLEKLWNYEKISAPFKEGRFMYYYKNDGLQNQFVLYRKDENGKEEIFLDPNSFSKDGTTSLAGVNFSKDGSLLAYSISEGGSDWRKVIVMEAESKKIIEDTLVDVKFSSISWQGNDGFYYSSYEKPKGSELSAKTDQHRLFYHKLGTSQSTDKIIFGDTQKRRYVGGYLSDDEQFLFISAANSTSGNELYFMDLKNLGKITPIATSFDFDHQVVHSEGTKAYILTNMNAPNQKLMLADLNNPDPSKWTELIPEKKEVLQLNTAGNTFFAMYMKDAVSLVEQYDLNGKMIRKIDLPGVGTASGFSSKKEEKTCYFTFSNYITPGTIYSLDVDSGKSEVYIKPNILFDASQFESKQVFYQSKDGTKVPMIITHKKGIPLDGTNPTMLYGYGGFNVSLTPSFGVSVASWLEAGGVYAVANIRGGGEYGKEWHDAGTQMKKQNVFDDFISAAEYLIKEKYCTNKTLAIRGGSNGGLLVGAVMTQRPDLIQVALPAVGVLDMLRYHTFTAGAGWAYDYGTSDQSEEMFKYLMNYSPLHNVKAIEYPATMITTADHDDRVVPAHSFKFAAELQAKQQGKNPVLIRIETGAGHGAGKPTSKTIQELADMYSFTFFNMQKEYQAPQ